MDTRRLIVFVLLAFTFVVTYQWIYNKFYPLPDPPPRTAQPAPESGPGSASGGPISGGSRNGSAPSAPTGGAGDGPSLSSDPSAARAVGGESTAPVMLGGGPSDTLRLELQPRGASVSRAWLTERRKNNPNRHVHRQNPRTNDPYELISPLRLDPTAPAGESELYSLTTAAVRIDEWGREFSLGDLNWAALSAEAGVAHFSAALRRAEDGSELLRISKTYALLDRPFLMQMRLIVENVSDGPLTPTLTQDGPIGIHDDDPTYDMRKLMWARWVGGALQFKHASRSELLKQINDPRRLDAGGERLAWAALLNKYFGVFIRPLTTAQGDPVARVVGTVAAPQITGLMEDAISRFSLTPPAALAPGASLEVSFEVYFGPKDEDILRRSDPAFADRGQLGFVAARDVDQSCCTFQPLPGVMLWLLETCHFFSRNYGIAIIMIVLIVRGLLHPLAVWQQKNMYRSQEAMQRIQPKLEALKEKYANDRVRLNQEIMRLWGEENVNPAAMLFTMAPLFLQLPILVALWTALSSDVNLRNAPFDGWWMVDLSAPDALLRFGDGGVHIPLLSMLTGPIHSLNLLPILMGVTMYLQQKYMPKPGQTAGRKPPPAPATPRKSGGMTPEETARMQQQIGAMMCIMFPVMFYNMPSGLTLYWMATNIFGIVESLRIRAQIRAEKERREREGPRPPSKRTGFMARFFKYVAEQAEELQKQADQVAAKSGGQPPSRKPRRK
ncbi:MAG: YidC/Oxa1 family insertase periplasmic-domain containing protein [Phycisphaerales bacterium]|nr:YidC/Oxa1 family insertase periplasmic-domain containing protein [Phycisphaerales bacterium]